MCGNSSTSGHILSASVWPLFALSGLLVFDDGVRVFLFLNPV
jgi:hypothetical protein